ncbi:MAG: HEAT repeat domain-containing protein [Planctomycetota bacterium]
MRLTDLLLASVLTTIPLPTQAPAGRSPAAPSAQEAKTAIAEMETAWPRWKPDEKIAAVGKLAALGGTAVAKALAARLDDPVPEVRRSLAASLGRLKDPKAIPAIPALAAALEREHGKDKGDLETFKAIAKALGEIGDPKAIEPLTLHLLSGDRRDADWQAQANARLDALGGIRHKDAVEELISLLGRTGGAGRRGGGGNNQLTKSIERNLQRLTGQNLRDQNAWRSWWKDNRDKFRFS